MAAPQPAPQLTPYQNWKAAVAQSLQRVPRALITVDGWRPIRLGGGEVYPPCSFAALPVMNPEKYASTNAGYIIGRVGNDQLVYLADSRVVCKVPSTVDLKLDAKIPPLAQADFFDPVSIPGIDISIIPRLLQEGAQKAIYYIATQMLASYYSDSAYRKLMDRAGAPVFVYPANSIEGITERKVKRTYARTEWTKLNMPTWLDYQTGVYGLRGTDVIIIRQLGEQFQVQAEDSVKDWRASPDKILWLPLHVAVLAPGANASVSALRSTVFGSVLARKCTSINPYLTTAIVQDIINWVSVFEAMYKSADKSQVTIEWRRHAKSTGTLQVDEIKYALLAGCQLAARLQQYDPATTEQEKKACENLQISAARQDAQTLLQYYTTDDKQPAPIARITSVQDFSQKLTTCFKDIDRFRDILKYVGYTCIFDERKDVSGYTVGGTLFCTREPPGATVPSSALRPLTRTPLSPGHDLIKNAKVAHGEKKILAILPSGGLSRHIAWNPDTCKRQEKYFCDEWNNGLRDQYVSTIHPKFEEDVNAYTAKVVPRHRHAVNKLRKIPPRTEVTLADGPGTVRFMFWIPGTIWFFGVDCKDESKGDLYPIHEIRQVSLALQIQPRNLANDVDTIIAPGVQSINLPQAKEHRKFLDDNFPVCELLGGLGNQSSTCDAKVARDAWQEKTLRQPYDFNTLIKYVYESPKRQNLSSAFSLTQALSTWAIFVASYEK